MSAVKPSWKLCFVMLSLLLVDDLLSAFDEV